MGGCCSDVPYGTNLFIYFSHLLSSWGDRMWSFGVGLFLIIISPESLQLSASYGLSMGVSTLLFGSLVGDIVDKSARLKVAQIAMVLQNLFVLLCAVVVYFFLVYRGDITAMGPWARYLVYGLIIIFSIVSNLTSMARTIAVENDWIVQMCGSDFDLLATMTATLRRIDLVTQILAPIATGLIMSFKGVEFGALFIGAWNVFSVFGEYYLLWKVYNTVPSLKQVKDLQKSGNPVEGDDPSKQLAETDLYNAAHGTEKDKDLEITSDMMAKENPAPETQLINTKVEVKNAGSCPACCRRFGFLEGLYKGWPVYIKYPILHAGLSLACLYMTVLGFDSITVGFIKLQGVSEALVGLAMGVAAGFGVFGTLMYPLMRRHLGLARTGIFGLSLELMSLVLCVASIWMPGSPFDLSLGIGPANFPDADRKNCTKDEASISYNISILGQETTPMVSDTACEEIPMPKDTNISIWLFLAGIIAARFGLWVAGLSVNQIYFETVIEQERGKVGGVQTALNQFMDMIKFGLVIILPYQHQFGLLVLFSFAFIGLGWLLYAFFLHKTRGLFHFEKCLSSCGNRALEDDQT
ncbi:solute carrier family 40 member 1 [Plakobranchus ocellatus]|uniref:Solute carrier family 40 member n=1 Tax=Plakobranchus ocellatus TaxID=259542 RepID=A0AAV3XY22_9GAST|nr:solute carrier family 40 member 1 [Plakobranchus ocellatus]